MIRLPLFGKDSSPHRTSLIIAIIATIVLWVIMLVSCIFINPNDDKKEFEVVRIILDSTPVEEEPAPQPEVQGEAQANTTSEVQPEVQEQNQQLVSEEPPAPVIEEPAPEPVQEPEPTPAPVVEAPKPVEKTPEKKVTEPKPEPKQEPKPEPVPEKPVETVHYDLVKSAEELWAEQQAAKKNAPKPSWEDMFGDDSDSSDNTSTTTTTPQKVVNTQSTTSGGAANVAETQTQRQTSQVQKNTGNQTTSDSTSEALKNIGNTQAKQDTGNKPSVDTNTPGNTPASGTGIKIQMSDGSKRALREPKSPEIILSKSAQQTVENNTTVTVSFSVQNDGHVLRSSIKFTPASVLSSIIQNEIIDQVSKWVFDPANTSAIASFEYTIKKKQREGEGRLSKTLCCAAALAANVYNYKAQQRVARETICCVS